MVTAVYPYGSGDIISPDGSSMSQEPLRGGTLSHYYNANGVLVSTIDKSNYTKTVTTNAADGSVTTTQKDGSYVIVKQDKTVISFSPSDGTTITTKPDGTKITDNKDGSWLITFPKKPDGSISTYYENGTTFTKMPDGRTIVH